MITSSFSVYVCGTVCSHLLGTKSQIIATLFGWLFDAGLWFWTLTIPAALKCLSCFFVSLISNYKSLCCTIINECSWGLCFRSYIYCPNSLCFFLLYNSLSHIILFAEFMGLPQRLLFAALVIVSAAVDGAWGDAMVTGTVFCDQCQDGQVSLFDYPLHGAFLDCISLILCRYFDYCINVQWFHQE